MLLLPAKSHAAPPLFACKRAHNALACYQLFPEKGKGTAFSLPSVPRFCPSVFPAQPKIGRRCKVSADFYFFTIHDSLFTAWQGRFLEGNNEERRAKRCGGGALRRNKKRGKDAGPPQEKPQTFPPEAVRLAANFLRLRARAPLFLSGLQFPYKIPAGEAQRDFPCPHEPSLTAVRLARSKSPGGLFAHELSSLPLG